ncbi:MAG: ACT domain-containing protein [Ferruginibacter sp.]
MFNEEENKTRLSEVIKLSWFTVEDGAYIYTSVKEIKHPEKHLMLINDGKEITVVTLEENLPLLGAYEANKDKWRLINIRCGNPFYCSGFIAHITNALAAKGIDIVLTSSFSNDLVMVMERDLEVSVGTLVEIGFVRKEL